MGKLHNTRGYTLIEIVISLTIISFIFFGGFAAYREFVRRQVLDNAVKELKSNLNLIRQDALSGNLASVCSDLGVGNTLDGYQVVFEVSSYSYSPKCSSINPGEGLKTITLPNSVTLSTSGFAGALIFKSVSGTNLTANAVLTLTHSTGAVKSLTINTSGIVQ